MLRFIVKNKDLIEKCIAENFIPALPVIMQELNTMANTIQYLQDYSLLRGITFTLGDIARMHNTQRTKNFSTPIFVNIEPLCAVPMTNELA